MASITISAIPNKVQMSSDIHGDSKFIVFNTNGEPASVSVNQLLDKLDDQVIDKIDDELLEQMEGNITDKLEDQIGEIIDDRLENADIGNNLNWNDVT